MQFYSGKIVILCISDSHKHYATAIEECSKRLGKQVEIISLKPQKSGPREQIIQKESQMIFDRLEKYQDWKKVVLGKGGKQRSSEQFAEFLETCPKIVFVIGGPYGFDETMFPGCDVMSFGLHTMPHGLALLTLLEQIWRGKCIVEGREYHY